MTFIRNILITLLFFITVPAFAGTNRPVSITLPDTLIKEVVHKALPVDVPIDSKAILGSVSIDAIKNIKLHKNKLSGHVTLSGHKLNIVTSIAGHKLRMKIGSLTMGFQCDASVRFDPQKQILHIKPVITELQTTDKAKTEVASLIAQLFNGREFPLQLKKLKPFAADTGDKTVNIAMHVKDVKIFPGEVHLQAIPKISVSQKK